MSHQMIEIPEGDGTPALKQIHRNWIKVCHEMLLAVREGRDSLSRGIEAFAETVMFDGAQPGERSNASANVMLTLESLLKYSFNANVQLSMSPTKIEENCAFAALLLTYEGNSAELIFRNIAPYASIRPAGEMTHQTRPQQQFANSQPKQQPPPKTNNDWNEWDAQTQNSRQDRQQQQAQWQRNDYPPQYDSIVQPPAQQPMQIPARFRGEKPQYKQMTPYNRPRRPLPPAQVEVQTVPFGGGAPLTQSFGAPPRPVQSSRMMSMRMWEEADAVPAPTAPLDPDAFWRNKVGQY